jgi:hypothetical protein
MTTAPINLTQLKKDILRDFGPPSFIAWDQEPDYFQVYGDNGTICITDDRTADTIARTLRAAFALIDTAEAAIEFNRLNWTHTDPPSKRRLRETLNPYTTTP